MSEEKGKERDQQENCVICLEQISEKAVAAPCLHAYDYLCLLNWLELRQSCPLCNTTVNHVEVLDSTLGKVTRHQIEAPKPALPPSAPITYRGRPILPPRRRPRRSPSPVTEDTAILRRRYIYRHNLRSHHIGTNRLSRFTNFTPTTFRATPELQSRARTWIRRELQVFSWTAAIKNREFLLEYILGILKSVDLKSATGAAEDMLTDFLGRRNAQVFCHEMHAFLRSPFGSLEAFDAFVQYAEVVPKRFDEEDGEGGRGGRGG